MALRHPFHPLYRAIHQHPLGQSGRPVLLDPGHRLCQQGLLVLADLLGLLDPVDPSDLVVPAGLDRLLNPADRPDPSPLTDPLALPAPVYPLVLLFQPGLPVRPVPVIPPGRPVPARPVALAVRPAPSAPLPPLPGPAY